MLTLSGMSIKHFQKDIIYLRKSNMLSFLNLGQGCLLQTWRLKQ